MSYHCLAEAHAFYLQHMAAPDERQAQGRSSSPGRSSFQPSTANASAVSMPLDCASDQLLVCMCMKQDVAMSACTSYMPHGTVRQATIASAPQRHACSSVCCWHTQHNFHQWRGMQQPPSEWHIKWSPVPCHFSAGSSAWAFIYGALLIACSILLRSALAFAGPGH